MISMEIHFSVYLCKRRYLEYKLDTVQDRKSGQTSEKHLEKCFEIQRELNVWEYSDFPNSWSPLVHTARRAVPFTVLFVWGFSLWEMSSLCAETTRLADKSGSLTNGRKARVS